MGVSGLNMQTGPQGWSIGQTVSCPKCGQAGRVGVDKFRSGKKVFYYWTVRHYEGSKVRRCIIAPYTGPRVEVETPSKAPEPKTEAKVVVQVPLREEVPREALDRAAWYATKLLLAYGTYRTQPSEEAYRQLLNVLHQVRERLQVDTSPAEAAIANLHSRQSTDNIVAATTTIKELVKAMVARALGAGVQAQTQAPVPAAWDLVQDLRDLVREEVSKALEALKVPEVRVSREDYSALYEVFRRKGKVPEGTRRRAYELWDQVFSPGRKVLEVEER
jgi:hypothetical protein